MPVFAATCHVGRDAVEPDATPTISEPPDSHGDIFRMRQKLVARGTSPSFGEGEGVNPMPPRSVAPLAQAAQKAPPTPPPRGDAGSGEGERAAAAAARQQRLRERRCARARAHHLFRSPHGAWAARTPRRGAASHRSSQIARCSCMLTALGSAATRRCLRSTPARLHGAAVARCAARFVRRHGPRPAPWRS